MNTQREQLIQTWLTSVLGSDQFETHFLAGDASFRRYARINLNNKTFMLMDAPPEKEDCGPFVTIDEFFAAHGVRVPKIVSKDLTQGFLLLEDFGDVLLSTLLNDQTVDDYYAQCFKQLIQLQGIDGTAHFPEYSYDKLISEMELLTDWLLPALQIQPSAEESALIKRTFAILANAAVAQPQVIVHRDFHSRNLMKVGDYTELGVIDFQDAVIGADTYDLISITRDAYVQWNADRVYRWFKMFYDLMPETSKQERDFEQFKKDADMMAIQRHIKILGIFVRLFERDGKSGYLKDLPRVMWYLLEESKPYPELQPFMHFIHTTVMPKFTAKYGQYEVVA
ncbi:phosphotransferase [Acinetobacter sp. KAM398]|uniref:aminoglycoside phosphotransferase family protein n=1 Tax=unclassified Acinetobacter TaxID=196816 RepID=UPI001F1D3CB0|nr:MULTISPECIES: phosphotransferase [unclassified Acinetobacter]GJC32041.1 phosphotransferase [Acinetobacter sp. KAM392]GJC34914.1 phosphotransferase [Acinetobacter sp. KAM393]GJC37671.1 phosphotransferase [Acinetobacter sp. KAM394]GJC40562.1 phosphotransferase [Acinetobacter sp. KAM395]GJC43391.1 phosphotransferase [Acinetobacter sp. KAM396]